MKCAIYRLICVAAAVAGMLGGCKKPGLQTAPMGAGRPPAPVTVVAAVTQDVPIYIDEIGRCIAYEYVSVVPQVSGPIVGIHFTDGAEVKKGDKLFTIDPRPFDALLAQAKAAVVQRKAERDVAQRDFTRVETLIGTKAISQQDYDTRQGALAVAEAQVLAADAAVETAKLRVDYCTVFAPIEGRAGRRLVDIGNVVKENDTSLVTIQRLDPIYAEFSVPERSLPAIREMMKRGTLQAQVWVPEDPQKKRDGELTFLDNTIQASAGTIKLRVKLKNEDRYFWAGQFVNVRLVLQMKKDAVLVPVSAMQVGQIGPFVYVVNGASTAELRPVKTGQRYDNLMMLDEGVKPGERVVTTGQMLLAPGAKVMVMAPATGPGAPTTNPAAVADPADKGDEQ
jgi:membrane fusion protein, multidrug efflux system